MSAVKSEAVKVEDLEVIVPVEKSFVIDGVDCKVKRLKTREFLGLMRVLTAGLGGALGEVRIDFTDADSVGRDLSALFVLAIPNAVDEMVLFLTQVVVPTDSGQAGRVRKYLDDNPDLDVLLDVFEVIAVQEKDDLSALAGKAQAMWSRLVPLYRAK